LSKYLKSLTTEKKMGKNRREETEQKVAKKAKKKRNQKNKGR